MAHARLVSVLALVVLGSLVGCKKPKGSCDLRADPDKTCEDILASTIKDSSKASCANNPTTHTKGTWSEGPCAHDDAIAGCQNSLSTTWYYPGSLDGRVTKVEHVAHMCSMGTLVDAKGKKLTGISAEPLPGQPKDREVEALVATVPPKMQQVLDGVRKIKLPSGPPSGVIRPTDGKLDGPTATIWEKNLTYFGINSVSTDDPFTMSQERDLEACDVAVKTKQRLKDWPIDSMKRAVEWCPKVDYAMVVRVTKYEKAEDVGADYFKSGKIEGHVYAFELPSAKPIGGFSFKAESSAKVKASEYSKDLRLNMEKALNAALKKASPTATVQFDL